MDMLCCVAKVARMNVLILAMHIILGKSGKSRDILSLATLSLQQNRSVNQEEN